MVCTVHGGMGEGDWAPHSPLSSEFQREVAVMVVVGMENNCGRGSARPLSDPRLHGHTGLTNPGTSIEATAVG